MVERYHLVLAAVSVVAGVITAVIAVASGPSLSRHALGLSALAGSVLGGAVLGVRAGPTSLTWIALCAAAAAVGDDGEPEHPLGPWTGVLAVVSLIGVWSAVPDTEPALAAIGTLTPVALVALGRRTTVGPVGAATLAVVVLGATWTGSSGRAAALAAGAAVAMVVVAPLVVGFGAQRWASHGLTRVAVAHTAIALVIPRLVMRRSAGEALVLAAVALVACAVVARWCRAATAVPPGS